MSEIEMLTLNIQNDSNTSHIDHIEKNKIFSELWKSSEKNSKKNNCIYCEKEKTSFCNSHSIPQFILKEVADNGDIFTLNKITELPFLKEKKGIKNAGVFKIICNDCDSRIFKEYENPDIIVKDLSQMLLAQIAMKNFLSNIGKRLIEIELYNQVDKYFFDEMINTSRIDLSEFRRGFFRSKNIIKSNKLGYKVVWDKKLDYKTPITFQNMVSLLVDLEDRTINNIYIKNNDIKIQALHICIFPYKENTRIIVFYDMQDKRYNNFFSQFQKLGEEEKLELVNYIIFLYSEEFYINPKIDNKILKSKELKEVAEKTVCLFSNPNNSCVELFNGAKKNFSFKNIVKITNFLSNEYKIID